jgi:hypothetical protein
MSQINWALRANIFKEVSNNMYVRNIVGLKIELGEISIFSMFKIRGNIRQMIKE